MNPHSCRIRCGGDIQVADTEGKAALSRRDTTECVLCNEIYNDTPYIL